MSSLSSFTASPITPASSMKNNNNTTNYDVDDEIEDVQSNDIPSNETCDQATVTINHYDAERQAEILNAIAPTLLGTFFYALP